MEEVEIQRRWDGRLPDFFCTMGGFVHFLELGTRE
ncbi:MAG: hypothetical protein JWQ03_2847, partial [Variovorax sp.]|nr:hypothetical protein [Variovorax sp.]